MKQVITLASLFILIGIVGFKNEQGPKSYSVTLSIEEWQGILNQLDSTRKIILDSDIPTRKTVYATSSLSFLTQSIQMQVSQQLAVEQKSDSAKPATKKPK